MKRVKLGHRESERQHQESDEENERLRMDGYRKGDQRSGGGGRIGGGGKKGRPSTRWEKADVRRNVDVQREPFLLRVKPGRQKRIQK